jgi:hypothetical protein
MEHTELHTTRTTVADKTKWDLQGPRADGHTASLLCTGDFVM